MSTPTNSFWNQLLHLPGYEVVFCQDEPDFPRYRFTLAPIHRVGVCPDCGKVTDCIHQTRSWEDVKDLSLCDHAVELTVRVPQFECLHCQRFFTPAVAFMAEGAHATERFLEHAARLIRTSDLANTAAVLGVPERTLANWYYDYLQRRPAPAGQKVKPIHRLGIDEIALKKKTSNTRP